MKEKLKIKMQAAILASAMDQFSKTEAQRKEEMELAIKALENKQA